MVECAAVEGLLLGHQFHMAGGSQSTGFVFTPFCVTVAATAKPIT